MNVFVNLQLPAAKRARTEGMLVHELKEGPMFFHVSCERVLRQKQNHFVSIAIPLYNRYIV